MEGIISLNIQAVDTGSKDPICNIHNPANQIVDDLNNFIRDSPTFLSYISNRNRLAYICSDLNIY